MEYRTGTIGRVFLARFDHGEPIVPALADLCRREEIGSGWFFLFGAAEEGRMVTGPREARLPPDPVWTEFREPHEILATGSVARKDGGPAIHLHAALGRGREALAGCIRDEGKAFIVVEALLLEIAGIAAARKPDARTGMELLSLE
jgi:predicted DNA-binding protein with PD1-like motif